MTRRPGLTLIEALVAMFIAAMGMIGILTLFPLGALQMGQALKDGRCAQAAQQSDGLIRWYWAKYETVQPMNSLIQQRMNQAYLATPLSAVDQGPSYPVLIDPIGWRTAWNPSTQQSRVASLDWFPRETLYRPQTSNNVTTYLELLQPPNAQAPALRFAMLKDDLTFADNTGAPSTTASVERGGRYTWAWLVQRPNNTQRGIVDLKIIVYDQRAPFYSNALTETSYANVNFTPGTTSLTLSYGSGARPPIQRGRWVCDVTLNTTDSPPQPLRHANFYRVVSVNDETPGTLYLELENPIRRSDNASSAYTGTLAALNGVAEVFDRPYLTPPVTP